MGCTHRGAQGRGGSSHQESHRCAEFLFIIKEKQIDQDSGWTGSHMEVVMAGSGDTFHHAVQVAHQLEIFSIFPVFLFTAKANHYFTIQDPSSSENR